MEHGKKGHEHEMGRRMDLVIALLRGYEFADTICETSQQLT